METVDLQSSQYLDSIVEEPLHGYDGSNKGDPNGQASCEQIAKSNTFHSLKAYDEIIRKMIYAGV